MSLLTADKKDCVYGLNTVWLFIPLYDINSDNNNNSLYFPYTLYAALFDDFSLTDHLKIVHCSVPYKDNIEVTCLVILLSQSNIRYPQ